MLRIHFTAEDLTRVRVRADPHPLWEVLLSLHLLQTRHGALMFGQWRRDARAALRPSGDILTTLAPPKGYSPDFLTPLVDSDRSSRTNFAQDVRWSFGGPGEPPKDCDNHGIRLNTPSAE